MTRALPGARRRRVTLAAGLIAIGALLGVAGHTAPRRPVLDAAPAATLTVSGPASVSAGAPWPLEVDLVDGTTVVVEVAGPWGVRRLETQVTDGSVLIPGSLMQRRGRWSVSLRADDSIGRVAVTVVPGPAVDGITPLAGPRSIVADGSDWTMVTAIPVDRFGNPVADGTPVSIHVRRPDGSVDLVRTTTGELLAGVRVTSGTIAGRSTIRVGVDGATGSEVEVLEVPGPPVAVELDVSPGPLRADGRSLVRLATAPLVDVFGNLLLDGTAASLVTVGPSGVGTLTSVTIDGRAEFVLESPPEPGTVEVRASVAGVAAAPVSLDFAADVTDIPVAVSTVTERMTRLDVGPVLTALGGFAPDGTRVVARGGNEEVVSELADGVTSLEVAVTAGRVLTVEVLGVHTEVAVP